MRRKSDQEIRTSGKLNADGFTASNGRSDRANEFAYPGGLPYSVTTTNSAAAALAASSKLERNSQIPRINRQVLRTAAAVSAE